MADLKIEFSRPFSFWMEVVETDDRVLSMRVETRISIPQFQHTLNYQGAFWIECAAWSRFTSALGSLPKESAVLADISGYFALKLYEEAGKLLISWAFRKDDAADARTAMAAFYAEIDDSMLGRIRSEFADFPVWWRAD